MPEPGAAGAELKFRHGSDKAEAFFLVGDGFCLLVFQKLSVGTGGRAKGKVL